MLNLHNNSLYHGFLSAAISPLTFAGTVLVVNPIPINTIAETMVGKPTSMARLLNFISFVMINVISPAIIEAIAALGPQDLNTGSRPKIKGIAVGPTNAANQLTISPNTPPNLS